MENILKYSESLATFLVGGIAILLFYIERRRKKIDSARIILQEIRRAEQIINEYKEHGEYKFFKKLVATDSWDANIHFFVGDLDQDEIDKISTLYSTGKYLDAIIAKASDTNYRLQEENFTRQTQQIVSQLPLKENNSFSNKTDKKIEPSSSGELSFALKSPWKDLLDAITFAYEPIYHSNIGRKLKKIAHLQ